MAKIHTLKISNYRGVKSLECTFGFSNFICLIGRGDSGKTTILNAISSTLSPRWNLPFSDTDFHQSDITEAIEIEVTLYDVPKVLLTEHKFGLHIRGIDKADNSIHDELGNGQISALTIKLRVDDGLEPEWTVVNERANQEPKIISARDRASLNMFMISDHTDSHFSWNQGTALYSLLTLDTGTPSGNPILLKILREAKAKVDSTTFSHMDNVVKKIKQSAETFGIDISKTETTIDFKDISIKEGKVSLHDGAIPFKLKGKGSKRLISIAIQTELAKSGGVLLVDEIEQGLEPDRTQHLVQTLKRENKGQVFITTHSRNVMVELEALDLFRVKGGESKLYQLSSNLQGTIRSNPEAFFAEKIIVAEGATEVGFTRGLNAHRISEKKHNMAFLGVRCADGGGSNQVDRSLAFLESGYEVCMFCDSDDETVNNVKEDLGDQGITIIDCENQNSIEQQIFLDLPWVAVQKIMQYMTTEDNEALESNLSNHYSSQGSSLPVDWETNETQELRQALGAISKKKGFLKRIDHGEFIAEVCMCHFDNIKDKTIGQEIEAITNWIDS